VKKLLLIIILSMVFLTSCSLPNIASKNEVKKTPENATQQDTVPASTAEPTAKLHTIAEYYPFVQNRSLKYEGKGNEYASMTVYVDLIKNNRVQLRVINGGTISSKVLENKDGELRLLYSIGEFYYRNDLTAKENSKPEILLKEPFEKGTSWILPNGNKRYISGIDVDVATPSGDYKAIEVTTDSKDSKSFDYYALNTGLIKTVFSSNGDEISSTLSKISSDVPVVQTVKFYYPDFKNNTIVYVKHVLNLKTNEDVKSLFEKYFKESPDKTIPKLLGTNTKVNSLSFIKEKNLVCIDLSKDFVKEMNAGTSLESMILTSITDSLGNYFNVDKVYITIDGKPYSSGHILMKQNEPFYVNYKNAKAYK
jgi:hypothetical protein